MKQVSLNGVPRKVARKSETKNIRKSGLVPCVLYGPKMENLIFTVDAKELKVITHNPNSYIINLNIEGQSHLAIIHELQFDPVTDDTIHVDFIAVSADKPVAIDVPISVFGNSEGVKLGGKLTVDVRKLRVSGLIDAIPDVLPIDITALKLGKQINAGDLHFEGVQMVTPKHTCVCSVRMTRQVVDDAAAAEGADAAAPAASEAKK